MPSRTIVITGTTDGLGRALARHLAADGERLILHGRDQDKLDALVHELVDAGPADAPEPATVRADLADLTQVRDLAQQVGMLTDHVDVLVNNAGVGGGGPSDAGRAVSADEYELRFAVNYLSGFDLTLRLLPLLRATGGGARVVFVASLGQQALDFDDVMLEQAYSGGRAYNQSKLAQITAGFTLAERLPAEQVTVNSLHPATYMPTKMVMDSVGHSIDTIETGEAATYRLVSDPTLDGVTGRFYDRQREAQADDSAYDPDVQKKLWQLSLDLTGAPDPS